MKNGNRTKRILSLILAACITVVFTGCATFDSFRHTFLEDNSDENVPVITIGVFEPQTGSNSAKGRDEIKGIELANSIYNNVDGYKVVIYKVDTQSKVSSATTAVQGLIEMKPVAIIGSAGEATSLAAAAYIEEAGIPTITPSATNPLITQTNDYYFRACITESQMGEGIAEYAYRELESRNIAVISLKNDSSTAALLDGFDRKIKKLAGKRSKAVKSTSEITATDEEIDAALDDARSSGCDACFVSLGNEAMDRFFAKAEEKGMTDITYLGVRSWGSPDFVSMMKKHPDIKVVFPYSSVISGTDSENDKRTEEAERFRIEYENRYGSDDIPSDNAALGYDAYLLVINAIHNAKSLEGPAIRDALLGLKDLRCATGVFSFDEKGNVVRKVTLSTISGDKVVTEYVTKSEAEAAELEDIEKSQEGDK